MAPDPSPRAIGTERGCVEDQPQRVRSPKASGARSVLRLVEDDTAALRFQHLGSAHRRFVERGNLQNPDPHWDHERRVFPTDSELPQI